MKNGHPKMAADLNETYHRNAQRDQFTMKAQVFAIAALCGFFVFEACSKSDTARGI